MPDINIATRWRLTTTDRPDGIPRDHGTWDVDRLGRDVAAVLTDDDQVTSMTLRWPSGRTLTYSKDA